MKPSPNKIAGRLGVMHVERAALDAGCKPIQVPEDLDTGIDGLIEFSEDNGVTKLVAYQVKRGASFFDARGPRHQTDARHLRYWMHYAVPVLLIIVREDDSEAFWMDARQHATMNPRIVTDGPHVLRPPMDQPFTADTLAGTIRACAEAHDFGDAISALTDNSCETRASAVSLFYRFRMERRTPFCLSAALRVEGDPIVLAAVCDFYSRYLQHPETTFGAEQALSTYARSLLTEFSHPQLLSLLTAFNDDEEHGDWDGATEFFGLPEDMIWDRYDIITRGTIQQGVAEVVGAAATSEGLLSVMSDPNVSLQQRKSATALFGYLQYTCSVERLDTIDPRTIDAPLRALLAWLRYWIFKESQA
ncbi:MAG TPA: DUF4365 domain-containing protein [Polyangiaceae bacterium]|jgi:hypothetical protein|nr:DUF4365 domain-containing protein [Polyangiaceae bacterium]